MPITKNQVKINLKAIRQNLIALRDNCLGEEFDTDGAVILSHAIRWLYFKIENKPYESPTD